MTCPLNSCPSLSGVLPQLLFLQNLPSVVVGHVLNPQPGEAVLDMCAAPGKFQGSIYRFNTCRTDDWHGITQIIKSNLDDTIIISCCHM